MRTARIRWLSSLREPHIWLVVGMLALGGVLHYLGLISPRLAAAIPPDVPAQTIERILLILPVVYAGFIFGLVPGLFALLAAVFLMLPQAVHFHPLQAVPLFETAAVALAGGVILLWFEGQRKEKRQRLEALGQLEEARQELSANVDRISKSQHQLQAMHEVCKVTTHSLDISSTLRHLVETVAGMMGMETAIIFLFDEESGLLELAAQVGLPAEFDRAQEISGQAELLGKEAVRTGKAQMSPEPAGGTTPAQSPAATILCLLAVPLLSKGRIIGILSAARRGRKFLPEEASLLVAIGDQAGVVIENAQLYQEMRDSERNYRDLFDNASVPMFKSDVSGTVTAANKAFSDLTGYTHQDLVGMKVDRLREPGTAGLAREVEERMLAGQDVEQPYEIRLLKKDGAQCIVSVSTRLTTESGYQVAFEHVASDVTEQVRMRSSLDFYLRQILTAQEDERTRIARELHDDTAQELLVICQQLDALVSDGRTELPGDTRSALSAVWARALKTSYGLRRMAQDLRPHILDTLGLVAALEWLAEDLHKQCGIAAQVEVRGKQRALAPEKELLSFRIAQEGLRNVLRHSHASTASIRLEFADSRMRMTIEDDGVGFAVPEKLSYLAGNGKLGLVGMQERARLLGGSVTVRSAPGAGTTVVAELPT